MSGEKFTIKALKYDGAIHRSWKCELIERRDSLLIFLGVFDREVSHPELSVIRRGTISYEYYWLDRYYNIFRFHEPDGALRSFYCNVNLLPVLTENELIYVDLDIDVAVERDFRYRILDVEEFEANAALYGYSAEHIHTVAAAVSELETLIRQRIFPFDYVEPTL